MKKSQKILLVLAVLGFVFVQNEMAPELPSAWHEQPLVSGKHSMVVTNNSWATQAAQKILDNGGNAVDAAIAAGFVLGLTEPQSSGLGGGGYALTYSQAKQKLLAYDGREVAPHTAHAQWFLDAAGEPLPIQQAILSAKSVGVPGEVALFYKLHRDQGVLAWEVLLEPAISLAENGFPMSQRLFTLLTADKDILKLDANVREVYFLGEEIKPIGSMVKNPAYANTLKMLAQNPRIFYQGLLAREIIAAINAKAGANLFNQEDFVNYKVKTYPAVCSDYRQQYRICSVPPSSSGGVTLQELLRIYARVYSGARYDDPKWQYYFLEASKLAYADRNQYIADPSFVKQPVAGLLADDYIARRSELIKASAMSVPVAAGVPLGVDAQYAPDASVKLPGTTSIVIVDKDGNAMTMTVTVESQFGSHIFTHGFFLNNELTDFSFTATDAHGRKIANRVASGKRPRSSMAPALVFDKHGKLYAISGSPGGGAIICYVAKSLILMLDMHMTPAQASATANLCAMNAEPVLERADYPMVSGTTNIIRQPTVGWYGAADPRREGMAVGR